MVNSFNLLHLSLTYKEFPLLSKGFKHINKFEISDNDFFSVQTVGALYNLSCCIPENKMPLV